MPQCGDMRGWRWIISRENRYRLNEYWEAVTRYDIVQFQLSKDMISNRALNL